MHWLISYYIYTENYTYISPDKKTFKSSNSGLILAQNIMRKYSIQPNLMRNCKILTKYIAKLYFCYKANFNENFGKKNEQISQYLPQILSLILIQFRPRLHCYEIFPH